MTPTTEQLKDLLAMGEAGYSGAWDNLEKIAPTLAAEVVRLREALNWIADHGYGDGGRDCAELARQALDATSTA